MKTKPQRRATGHNKLAFAFMALGGLLMHGKSHAAIVAYEGFDYSAGDLNTRNGGSGWGGAWSANVSADVVSSDLTYGNLDTTGGSVAVTGGANHFGGARAIDLITPGLLANGTELWFSMMMGYNAAGNRSNSQLTLVLGDESMKTANGTIMYNFPTVGATGLGVTLGRFGTNGKIVATQIGDTTNDNNSFGTGQATTVLEPTLTTNVDYRFVVGRITWGAIEDMIDIFLPGTDLALGSVHSTLTVNVNQSGYDTVSWRRGDGVVLDEIRFGSSYAAVSPIPEPRAALLGGLGLLALLRRRR